MAMAAFLDASRVSRLRILCFDAMYSASSLGDKTARVSFDLSNLADLAGLLDCVGAFVWTSSSSSLHSDDTSEQSQLCGGPSAPTPSKMSKGRIACCLPSPIYAKLGKVVGIVESLCKMPLSSVKEATISIHIALHS